MAFPLDLKVVKVGDVVAPPEGPGFLWPDTSTPESTEIALDQLTHRSTTQHPTYSGGWTVYHNHDHDLVKPVIKKLELPPEGSAPANWHQIPQLARRRSCEASGERTNCVNKAVEHLQLLQDILSDWVQKTEKNVSKEETNADKKLSIFDSDSNNKESEPVPSTTDVADEKVSICVSDPKNKEAELVPSTTDVADKQLSICYTDPKNKGTELVPLKTDVVPSISVRALKDYNSHAELKSVVSEVMLLIAWLHDDCTKTEAKLNDEKVLESQLSLEIDQMSRRKIIDLTAAVQEEHETFKLKNRNELVTLTYLNRISAKFNAKLKLLKNLNFHLNKDIAISSKQIPLVQDKMLLENQHIDSLQRDLDQEHEVLSQTVMNEAETNAKHREAENLYKQELRLIDQQLNDVCIELNQVSRAAEMAEKKYYSMNKGIVDGQKQNKDNEKEITVLKVKSDNQKTKYNAIVIKNKNQKDNLVQKLKETKQMKSKNKELEEKFEEKTNSYKEKVIEVSDYILKLEKEVQSLLDFNESKNKSIESMRSSIEESKRQTDFYEKSLKRLSREIQKLENQTNLTSLALKRMQDLNKLLKQQLDEHHQRNDELEKSLQNFATTVKKELQAENNYFLRMTSHINELELELRIEKAEAKEEEEKLQSKTNEVAEYLKKLKDKFDRLSILKKQKDQALFDLREDMKSKEEHFTKITTNNEEYLSLLTPYQKESQERCIKLKKKMKDMMEQEEKMKREIKMMVEQSHALEALVAKIDTDIEKVKEILEELNIKLETASKLSKSTKIRWNQVVERIREEREEHSGLMRCRKETLEEILQKKNESLKENEQLASKYRVSQFTLSHKREENIKFAENTLLLKQTLKDFKQLVNLQVKMQHNSQSYCEYRGLYHSKQLAYIVNTSESNQIKVKELQDELKSKVEMMTKNLKESMVCVFRKKPNALPKLPQLAS